MSRADAALGDEARFELSLAAAGRERANRPRALVALALLVLVLAMLGAVWGLASRRSTIRALRVAQDEQVRVDQLLKEWDRLEKQQPSGAGPLGGKIDGLYTKMEDLARRAGVKNKPDLPRQTETRRGDIKIIEYHYQNLKDASIKALLEWARLASTEIPGMEVYNLKLNPDPTNWTMNVTFRRWERAQ
jgi:hypothetical protein